MPRTDHPLTEAFVAGTDARADGRPLADNPHAMQSRLHEEWSAGWSATLDLDEEDDPLSSRMRKQDDITPAD
jgi:hypothetical protein